MPIFSFEPIVDDHCKVLLLGTMPGVISLKRQQYYGNMQNNFWAIIYSLFEETIDEAYDNRKKFLLAHHIAVWDVLEACEREGSSDSDIKDPVPNDFAWLFKSYPNIVNVCFNGGPAERLFKRYVEKRGVGVSDKTFYSLPSTSPAYTIGFEKKFERWKLLLKLLEL